MFTTFGFWTLILNILVLVVSVSGFIKITKNDLFHLEKSVSELKDAVEKQTEKIEGLGERVSRIEGKMCISK